MRALRGCARSATGVGGRREEGKRISGEAADALLIRPRVTKYIEDETERGMGGGEKKQG